MMLTVTKVMFQVIASIFEDVVAFIFGFPTAATGGHNGFNISLIDLISGDKGIEIQLLAGIFTSNGQFTPVDLQSLLTPA